MNNIYPNWNASQGSNDKIIDLSKKVLEDFNGAIEAYSKAIEINKNQ